MDDDVVSVTDEEGSDDIFSSKEELHLTSKTWKPFGAFFNLKLDKVVIQRLLLSILSINQSLSTSLFETGYLQLPSGAVC